MFTRLWKRLGQSRRPSARPAPALGRKALRLEALEDRLAMSCSMPLGDTSGCSCPAAVPAQSLCTESQHAGEDLIRLRRVVQDAAPTLVTAAGHALHGQGSGQYECDFFPDAGMRYRLGGTADLAGLGQFEVSGSVRSVGFIRLGRAGGELTLSNACGSVRLLLLGPVQPGFSHLPGTFSYRVVGATGAYLGLHATGALHLALSPASGNGGHALRGTFTVSC